MSDVTIAKRIVGGYVPTEELVGKKIKYAIKTGGGLKTKTGTVVEVKGDRIYVNTSAVLDEADQLAGGAKLEAHHDFYVIGSDAVSRPTVVGITDEDKVKAVQLLMEIAGLKGFAKNVEADSCDRWAQMAVDEFRKKKHSLRAWDLFGKAMYQVSLLNINFRDIPDILRRRMKP